MTRFWYTVLLYMLAPLIWTWMALRARRAGGEWGVLSRARFGRYDDEDTTVAFRARAPIWVHAVSLGETRAAEPLLRALLARGMPLLLTHTTATGRAEGARLFAADIAAGNLVQAWLPYDFPGATRRFLRHFTPRCGVLIEREVWPNLLRAAAREGVAMLLVSARMSARSLARSRRLERPLREAYSTLEVTLAQSADDAMRLRQLGVHQPLIAGNLKFDVTLPPDQVEAGRAWRRAVGRPIVVVASTRDGEEAMFLDALQTMRGSAEDALLADPARPLHVIVPRHPQRFGEVTEQVRRRGLKFVTRTSGAIPAADVDVLIGDTLGEMGFYYGAADVAVIGGGFARLGGQNLIEPCVAGVPVIVGPHMFNFAQATLDAVAAGAALQVDDAAAALRTAEALLHDDTRRSAIQQAALAWTGRHVGATARTVAALQPWLQSKTREVEPS
jgi:3-deoxy-D-manno-octulosonic-acid transferase